MVAAAAAAIVVVVEAYYDIIGSSWVMILVTFLDIVKKSLYRIEKRQ